MPGTKRYTLLLDEKTMLTVERLQRAYGLKTKADVFDLAVRDLHWDTEQRVNGYAIGRHSEKKGFEELLLLETPDKDKF